MSWLSELTGGIFLPLCCCTGWGSIEEGASRHAFTVANRFSAQWQNLALGLRFHCVLVGGERLSMSQSEGRVHVRSLVCPRSTLVRAMSSHFLRRPGVSLWTMHSIRLRNVQLWKEKTSSSTLSVDSHRRPILPKLLSDLLYVTLGLSFFTLPPLWGVSTLDSVYPILIQKANAFYPDTRIFN